MANYHIRAASPDGNAFAVVMHLPVPDLLNQAAVPAELGNVLSFYGYNRTLA